MDTPTGWREIYDGGTPEAEQATFLALARDMLSLQAENQRRGAATCPARTLHAKALAATNLAELRVDPDLPADLATAHFQPGATLPASIRFSSASGVPQPDAVPDMRGVAVRLALPDGGAHDLLMTSFPVSHARDARQFVQFALIAAAGDRASLPQRLAEAFGVEEARRMVANLAQGVRPCASLALERFWSRGAVLWAGRPVRYALHPLDAPPGEEGAPGEEGPAVTDLRAELAARLAGGPVRYRLTLQSFVDERRTPIEDGAIEWHEADAPPRVVATLVLHRQDLLGTEARAIAAGIETLAFNPWNAPATFRPLGNLNRARGTVYSLSAARWRMGHPA